jgi:hypothetical protein
MADILLKNRNDVDIAYKDVNYINLRSIDGETIRFNDGDIRTLKVSELPTEKIDEDAVYRIESIDEQGNTIVNFYSHKDGEWIKHGEKAPIFGELIAEKNKVYDIKSQPLVSKFEDGTTVTFKQTIECPEDPESFFGGETPYLEFVAKDGGEWTFNFYNQNAFYLSGYSNGIKYEYDSAEGKWLGREESAEEK